MSESIHIGEWICERKPRVKEFFTGEGWDSFAKQDWQFVIEENKYRIGEMIAKRLGEGKKILDLASGSWQYVPTHTTVDNSREMLLRNPVSHRLLFDLDELTEGHLLPLQDRFDAVLFCFGYNYVKDPIAVFREAKRLLQQEGKIFVAGGISGGCPDFSLRSFDADKIKAELEDLGLEAIVHNVVDASGLPMEFKIMEAAECIPEKQRLVNENVRRVKAALRRFEKRLRRDYTTIMGARKTSDANWATQEEIHLRVELEAFRQAGRQLEEKFGVQTFIIPHSPLKKDFKLEDLRFSYVGLVLVGEKLAKNDSQEFLRQVHEAAGKLLQDRVEVNGSYVIENAEKMAEHLNKEFQRTGKVKHIFFLSPHTFLYPSLYGDIQSFRKQVFEKSGIPKRIIERDLHRALWNDELAVKDIYSRLQVARKLAKTVEKRGYL